MTLHYISNTLWEVSIIQRSIHSFVIVASAIKEAVPSATVLFNLVPKLFAMSDIYCQLIPNEDDNIPNYEIVPRIGAFEISINGVVST
jgi:hypothetical protein